MRRISLSNLCRIPDKATGKVMEGTVVAVGPGFRAESGQVIPNQLKVGDRVLLPEYGGSKVVLDDVCLDTLYACL